MKMDEAPNPAVERLSFYLRELESLSRGEGGGRVTVSSKQLGEALGYSDAQVRKDLAYFGQFGHPGVGYRVEELRGRLRKILGTDKVQEAVLVGAGNLGRALLAYRGFLRKGFVLAAVFDADAGKAGQTFGDLRVREMGELAVVVAERGVKLGIIAVPGEAAQGVAEALVEAGVRGILNFAPVSLTVPEGVRVRAVDLAVELEQLSYKVRLGGGGGGGGKNGGEAKFTSS